MAVPALFTGILYDARAFDAARALAEPLTLEVVTRDRPALIREGLTAPLAGKPAVELAQSLFEIAVSGWLGGVPADAPPVLPELLRLDLARVQCFYGEQEEQTLCPDPALAGAEIVRTGGGHHFDGDYEALARRILDGAERRAASPAGR